MGGGGGVPYSDALSCPRVQLMFPCFNVEHYRSLKKKINTLHVYLFNILTALCSELVGSMDITNAIVQPLWTEHSAIFPEQNRSVRSTFLKFRKKNNISGMVSLKPVHTRAASKTIFCHWHSCNKKAFQ